MMQFDCWGVFLVSTKTSEKQTEKNHAPFQLPANACCTQLGGIGVVVVVGGGGDGGGEEVQTPCLHLISTKIYCAIGSISRYPHCQSKR